MGPPCSLPVAALAFPSFLAALSLLLQGCGGGGGGGGSECAAEQKAAHCSSCSDEGKTCTRCARYYELDTNGSSPQCVASCIRNPSNMTSLAIPVPNASMHNGKAWPDMCINKSEAHFFGLGDWGGMLDGPNVVPFRDLKGGRPFVKGVDDKAQLLVARQMHLAAKTSKPDFVLNAGDNFYPGGIGLQCGVDPPTAYNNNQFAQIFEAVYEGPDLGGKPWFGVFGNHDYGGIHFDAAWDLQIYYTWKNGTGWRTPAQFWSQKVQYRDFSVEFYMLDSNKVDSRPPGIDAGHNICNRGTCPKTGPLSNASCVCYFDDEWTNGLNMLEKGLQESTSEWQIVMTHYPSAADMPDFQRISAQYGIDLIFVGHSHDQVFDNSSGTPRVISGGGGGITSDVLPRVDGLDDAYGFVDFSINRTQLKIEMQSHGGVQGGAPIIRQTHFLKPRGRSAPHLTGIVV